MKKIERIWAIVALAALVANALPLAAAAPPPPGTVVISNVNVNRNSLSGTVANLSWSTNPTSSCDSVTYQVSGQSSRTISLPCKVHSASLTGLAVHVTTTFTITATARKYNPGTYSSSFFPTDVSTSKAYEGYNCDFWATGFCGTQYVYTNRAASMPGDVEFNPANAQNGNAYETFDAVVHYYGQGQAWCWPYQLTTKRTTVQFYARDMTSGDNSWIAANTYPVPSVSGGNYVGSVQWSISLGAQAYGGGVR